MDFQNSSRRTFEFLAHFSSSLAGGFDVLSTAQKFGLYYSSVNYFHQKVSLGCSRNHVKILFRTLHAVFARNLFQNTHEAVRWCNLLCNCFELRARVSYFSLNWTLLMNELDGREKVPIKRGPKTLRKCAISPQLHKTRQQFIFFPLKVSLKLLRSQRQRNYRWVTSLSSQDSLKITVKLAARICQFFQPTLEPAFIFHRTHTAIRNQFFAASRLDF